MTDEAARRKTAGSTSPAVHSRAAGLVLLVLLSLVWGAHWAIVKVGLGYMPPFTYAALRVGAGLATIVVLMAAQGRLTLPARRDVPVIISVGLGQVAFGVLVMNVALQVVPAGRSSVLVYSMPLWVAVLLAVGLGIRPRRREVIGLVLGLAGIAALLNPAAVNWDAPGEIWGTAALLLNAIVWAAVTIHIRRHRWAAGPLDLQPWQLLIALMPLVVLALLLEPGRPIRWDPATLLVLLYGGPLATTFATWASQSVTRSLGPLVSATGFLAVPVVGLASGALILGEQLTAVDIAGFGLVLAGIAATSLGPLGGTAGSPRALASRIERGSAAPGSGLERRAGPPR